MKLQWQVTAKSLTFHDLFEPNIVFDDIFLNEVKPEKRI